MSLFEIDIVELCETERSNCNGARRSFTISDESGLYRRGLRMTQELVGMNEC